MPKYPKVNFIGNKEKLIKWIIAEMPISKGTVLDLFSGGCSVSYGLKKAGYAVICNDVLFSNYVIAKALICNNDCMLKLDFISKKIDDRVYNDNLIKLDFLVDKLYFQEEINELAKLISVSEKLRGSEKYLFYSLLRRAMIRKLPYSRMNVPWEQIKKLRDEEYSYTKYQRRRAYHNKSFLFHINENLDDYNNAVFDNGTNCIAYNLDAFSVIKKIKYVDVVYMDPPYPSTMNNYDSFYGIFDEVFDKKKQHTDFTNKNSFLINMEKLILELSNKTNYVILSLNDKVVPSVIEIELMLKKYGEVTKRDTKHTYKVTGKGNKEGLIEVLLILKYFNI